MSHSLKLLGFMAIIMVSSILILQHPIIRPVAIASSSVYSSGFDQGCNDAGISDPGERSINQPGRNQSFIDDEFTKGYVAGFDICSKNRELEFIGVKISPDIGDITAVAALIASALVFWFGYVRTRKSEQIKVAKEQMNRISDMLFRRNEAINRGYPDEYQGAYSKWAYARDISEECERFGYMIYSKTITDVDTIRYYEPRIFDHFKQVNGFVGRYAKLVRENSIEDYERYSKSHIKILNGIITYWGRDWIPATKKVIDSLNTTSQDPSYFHE